MSTRGKPRSADSLDAAASPLYVTALAKGLAVMSAFSAERPRMSLAELAAATGVTRSSVQRIVHTLEALGYLRRSRGNQGYELTPRDCELGFRYLVTSDLVAASNPHLFDLNRRCGETVNLSEPDALDMVFVARFPGHLSIAYHMPVGHRLPMFCTASGRAWLSALDPEAARRVLARSDLVRRTPATIVDPRRLRALVAEAAREGYAYADSECYRGDINVAAPIVRAGGVAAGAINISVSSSRWTLERARAELAPLVIETARAIASKVE